MVLYLNEPRLDVLRLFMQGKDVSVLMVHKNLRETMHTFGRDANQDGYCKKCCTANAKHYVRRMCSLQKVKKYW